MKVLIIIVLNKINYYICLSYPNQQPDDQLFHRLTCHFLSGSVPGLWNSFE